MQNVELFDNAWSKSAWSELGDLSITPGHLNDLEGEGQVQFDKDIYLHGFPKYAKNSTENCQ